MESKDIVLLAVTLLILGEVSYLLAKLPRTNIKTKARAILVDTSVLMDGRITSVAATGFIGGTLVIPRSVVGELQLLADSADADKRARARYGLDVVSQLQHMEAVDVELLQDGSKADEGVDERLLTLAKQHHATICTLDFNLNKVAAVEGIQVLNINELAQLLRMSHLPGEEMVVELVQKGQDTHQGVGYLPDGTMVVVEQSSAYIGQKVHVEVVRSLQTAAGKMMFARRIDAKKPVSGPKAVRQDKQRPAERSRYEKTSSKERATSRQAPYHTPAPVATTHDQPTSPRQPAHQNQPARKTSNRRSPDREAALIALVNDQKDS